MPRPKKKVGVKKARKKSPPKKVFTPEELENIRYVELIDIVRNSEKKADEINAAFLEIVQKLTPQIMRRFVAKFNIPGFSSDDIYQESLVALRYKAIKDYDVTRGTVEGPAPFERFAMICIRRHLSTELKASFQNKHKVHNKAISLDQEQPGIDDDLSLINIVAADEGDVLDALETKEYYTNIMSALLKSLSKFENEVFKLYAQKNSYEEIADKINDKRVKIKVNIKGVDNALSRVKQKAAKILSDFDKKDEADEEDVQADKKNIEKAKKSVDNALERVKQKAKKVLSDHNKSSDSSWISKNERKRP